METQNLDRFEYRYWTHGRMVYNNIFSDILPETSYDSVFMACTGLMDSALQLIYEGDILGYDDLDLDCIVVEWRRDSTINNRPDYLGYLITWGENARIIGNIYENPNLIEERKRKKLNKFGVSMKCKLMQKLENEEECKYTIAVKSIDNVEQDTPIVANVTSLTNNQKTIIENLSKNGDTFEIQGDIRANANDERYILVDKIGPC